jgi:hypothetical protein
MGIRLVIPSLRRIYLYPAVLYRDSRVLLLSRTFMFPGCVFWLSTFSVREINSSYAPGFGVFISSPSS